MTDMEILQLADKCGVLAVTKHEWDGKKFNHTDDCLDGDGAALIVFAKQMMAQPTPFQPDWANFNEGRAVGWTEAMERIAEKIKFMPWEFDTKDSFLIWLKEQI